eukprot:TRINITY_DN26709_c0_g1_i1.p1 TRINITY_DN26709_c0_g1~~TRINITY_DN26709_c0_g1_i1.p1  ORF type:complete len:122 (-),score=6.84 TRINITY_DN26709_c0_g1_i1:58-423(-)
MSVYIYIGIDSSDKQWIDDDFSDPDINEDVCFYCCRLSRESYSNDANSIMSYLMDPCIESGHTVKMTLNISSKEIEYFSNGQMFMKYQNVLLQDKQYHFAVALTGSSKVRLIDLKITSISS